MKLRLLALPLASLLLAPAAAEAQTLTAQEIEDFRSSWNGFGEESPPLGPWRRALTEQLASRSPDQAADALAPLHGMRAADMRRLVRLYLTARARQFDLEEDSKASGAMRRQLLALLRNVPLPLVRQASAQALAAIGRCGQEDFDALIAGSAAPATDAFGIAHAAPCDGATFERAIRAAPDRAMPALIGLAHYGNLKALDQLALYTWLTGPEALARVAEADRPAVAALLSRRHIEQLFKIGLATEAMAQFEALSPDVQRQLVEPARAFNAVIDGIPVHFDGRYEPPQTLDLAAAYAVSGQDVAARALLATHDLAPARRAFDCAWSGEAATRPECRQISYGESVGATIDWLLIEHLLNDSQGDPYPFAEAAISDIAATMSGPRAALRCHIFAEPAYATLCNEARQSVRYAIDEAAGAADEADVRATLTSLPFLNFAAAREAVAARLARVAAAYPPAERSGGADRETIVASPPPIYRELPLPAALRSSPPTQPRLPSGLAPLPDGFQPVRVERTGERAAAISLSQLFDPSGEVSGGGYWLHLSNDRGRTWAPPIYTGLADLFPYRVRSSSRLPLLDGDMLRIEVDVAEIDTASITYPPVGLRSRRRASDLYIEAPLAALRRDSDGDGLSDTAERNLLLDRTPGSASTPFIVGTDDASDCTPPDSARRARLALLQRLFSPSGAAIVEQVDGPADPGARMAAWRSAASPDNGPLFIQGDPADYRCLRPTRLMIVYSEADVAALRPFHPDFRPTQVPAIIFNRARDRGFVRWSAGWTGGTYRLRLVDGAWVFDEVSSWIT